MHTIFEIISLTLECIGVAVIFMGILLGIFHALKTYFSHKNHRKIYSHIRLEMAHAILLGLEILIAVDIIKTVTTELTLENTLTLGLIVIIRTILSISLEVEIENRFPWQKKENDEKNPHFFHKDSSQK